MADSNEQASTDPRHLQSLHEAYRAEYAEWHDSFQRLDKRAMFAIGAAGWFISLGLLLTFMGELRQNMPAAILLSGQILFSGIALLFATGGLLEKRRLPPPPESGPNLGDGTSGDSRPEVLPVDDLSLLRNRVGAWTKAVSEMRDGVQHKSDLVRMGIILVAFSASLGGLNALVRIFF